MEVSKLTGLIFQNRKSTDFGLMVQYPFNLVHPVSDLTPTHIKGRSGDFLQDDNSYQNVTETFNVVGYRTPEMTQFEWEREVIDWLAPPIVDGQRNYQFLQFDIDQGYVYSAVVKDMPTFTWDNDDIFKVTGSVPFYCEPYQYRIDGTVYQNIPDGGVIYNTETRTAIPDWHFVAKGNFSLNVNGLSYQFENMDGEFWLNGQTGDTYDKDNNLFNNQTHFPNLVPPNLNVGKNAITITAETGTTISLAEYKPNWRRLI